MSLNCVAAKQYEDTGLLPDSPDEHVEFYKRLFALDDDVALDAWFGLMSFKWPDVFDDIRPSWWVDGWETGDPFYAQKNAYNRIAIGYVNTQLGQRAVHKYVWVNDLGKGTAEEFDKSYKSAFSDELGRKSFKRDLAPSGT